MTWTEIALFWIVLSIALPVLFGMRYSQLKEYRERLANARVRFHRFRIRRLSSLRLLRRARPVVR